MKVIGVVIDEVSAQLARTYWMSIEPYRTASELVVRVVTDDGRIGIGEIHGRPLGTIADVIASMIGPSLLGRDPLEYEAIWSENFSLCHSRAGSHLGESDGQPHFGAGSRPQIMAAIAGIDLALWDLKGKASDQPVWRLLGGARRTVPCYASGGYYGADGEAAVDSLVEELAGYVVAGFRAVKMKVGGLSVHEDLERVRAVRSAVGDDVDIMLDANSAYDVPTAIVAARAFEPYRIRWLEEPVHWYDHVRGVAQVARATSIAIASGESEMHRWGCRDLIELGGIRIMQFDATRAGGVTEWLRVAAYASANGVEMAPHHDPQIHGHLIAAAPNGHIQEVFPSRARDPLWESLYVDRPQIIAGDLHLTERPGFGFDVDPDGLTKFGRRRWIVGDVGPTLA
jgi:L-alanine-DL-glutamate epimerase-like enolase superfamily enzyme